MAQGVDGSWYAYIADGLRATTIDSNYPEVEDGKGADYGRWCGPDTNLEYSPHDGSVNAVAALVPSESRGVAIPYQLGNSTVLGNADQLGNSGSPGGSDGGRVSIIGDATFSGYTQGTGITQACDVASDNTGHPLYYLNSTARVAHHGQLATGVNATGEAINNVVREARALSNGTSTDFYGNIALGPNLWPFIQLYDFTRYQTYDLVYEKGGGDEVISLTFDRPGSGISFDKEHYGLNHEVGVTITNNEFNIDPTDEDSWTFGTLPTNATTFYQLFDENGNRDADNGNAAISFSEATAQANWAFDTGVLEIDVNGPEFAAGSGTSVLYFQDNGDQVVLCASGLCGSSSVSQANQAVTFTETGANTGVFTNWDDSLKTNMYINQESNRGNQATFSWDDVEYSVLNMPFWGTIEEYCKLFNLIGLIEQ
jgi:hypothetical protein